MVDVDALNAVLVKLPHPGNESALVSMGREGLHLRHHRPHRNFTTVDIDPAHAAQYFMRERTLAGDGNRQGAWLRVIAAG